MQQATYVPRGLNQNATYDEVTDQKWDNPRLLYVNIQANPS